jgi:hypothetical protein
MANDWWPEITIDVLESDLKKFGNRQVVTTDSQPSRKLDVNHRSSLNAQWVLCEQSLGHDIASDYQKKDKWQAIESHVACIETRLSKLKYLLCSSVFDALMCAAAIGRDIGGYKYSPLCFCAATGKTVSDVTRAVREHLVAPSDNSQDVKDIQRDCVVINGQFIKGAETGYSGILKMILELTDDEVLSTKAISMANRTFSGGLAFENVLEAFPHHLLTPVSSEADPLEFVVGNGLVFVRAHTRFLVQSSGLDCGEQQPSTSSRTVDANLYMTATISGVTVTGEGYLFIV